MLASHTSVPADQLLGLLEENYRLSTDKRATSADDAEAIRKRLGLLFNSMTAPADKKHIAVPVNVPQPVAVSFGRYMEAASHACTLHKGGIEDSNPLWMHPPTAAIEADNWVLNACDGSNKASCHQGGQMVQDLADKLRDLRASRMSDKGVSAEQQAEKVEAFLTSVRNQHPHVIPYDAPLYADWETQFKALVKETSESLAAFQKEMLSAFKSNKALACVATDATKQTFERLRVELIDAILWNLKRTLSGDYHHTAPFALQPFPAADAAGSKLARKTAPGLTTTVNLSSQFNNRLAAYVKDMLLRQLGDVPPAEEPTTLSKTFAKPIGELVMTLESNWKGMQTEVERLKSAVSNSLLGGSDDFDSKKIALYEAMYAFRDAAQPESGSSTVNVYMDELQRTTVRHLKDDVERLRGAQLHAVGSPDMQVSSTNWDRLVHGLTGEAVTVELNDALKQHSSRFSNNSKNPFAYAPEKAVERLIEDQRKGIVAVNIPVLVPVAQTVAPHIEKVKKREVPAQDKAWVEPTPATAASKQPAANRAAKKPPAVVETKPPTPHKPRLAVTAKYPFLPHQPCPGVYLEDLDFEQNPRFSAAMNRLAIKRNNNTHNGKLEVKEQERVVCALVENLAVEVRDETLKACLEMPFLEPRVLGVLLGSLMPSLEESEAFQSLLNIRRQIVSSPEEDATRPQRLENAEQCLRDEAQQIAASVEFSVDPDRSDASAMVIKGLLDAADSPLRPKKTNRITVTGYRPGSGSGRLTQPPTNPAAAVTKAPTPPLAQQQKAEAPPQAATKTAASRPPVSPAAQRTTPTPPAASKTPTITPTTATATTAPEPKAPTPAPGGTRNSYAGAKSPSKASANLMASLLEKRMSRGPSASNTPVASAKPSPALPESPPSYALNARTTATQPIIRADKKDATSLSMPPSVAANTNQVSGLSPGRIGSAGGRLSSAGTAPPLAHFDHKTPEKGQRTSAITPNKATPEKPATSMTTSIPSLSHASTEQVSHVPKSSPAAAPSKTAMPPNTSSTSKAVTSLPATTNSAAMERMQHTPSRSPPSHTTNNTQVLPPSTTVTPPVVKPTVKTTAYMTTVSSKDLSNSAPVLQSAQRTISTSGKTTNADASPSTPTRPAPSAPAARRFSLVKTTEQSNVTTSPPPVQPMLTRPPPVRPGTSGPRRTEPEAPPATSTAKPPQHSGTTTATSTMTAANSRAHPTGRPSTGVSLPQTTMNRDTSLRITDLSDSSADQSMTGSNKRAPLPPVPSFHEHPPHSNVRTFERKTTPTVIPSSVSSSSPLQDVKMPDTSASHYQRWKKSETSTAISTPTLPGTHAANSRQLPTATTTVASLSPLPQSPQSTPPPTGISSRSSTPLLTTEQIDHRRQEEKSARLREWTQILSNHHSPKSPGDGPVVVQRRLSDRALSQEREMWIGEKKGTASTASAPATTHTTNTNNNKPTPTTAATLNINTQGSGWKSSTFSGVRKAESSVNLPTMTANLYFNKTISAPQRRQQPPQQQQQQQYQSHHGNMNRTTCSEPAIPTNSPRPTVAAVSTRYIHRRDQPVSQSAGQSAISPTGSLSSRGGYQGLLREQAQLNQQLESKSEYLRGSGRSPRPTSPTATSPTNFGNSQRISATSLALAQAAAAGLAASKNQLELEFEAGTPLSEVYVRACHAYNMKPNSGLVRTFPSTRYTFLQRLDLAVNYVGVKGLLPILHVLEANSGKLEILSLSNNNLENREVLDLVEVLLGPAGNSLTQLDLSYNPVSQTGGQALLRLITARPSILDIKLKGTLIPPKMTQSIVDKVEDNAYRKHIGLRS